MQFFEDDIIEKIKNEDGHRPAASPRVGGTRTGWAVFRSFKTPRPAGAGSPTTNTPKDFSFTTKFLILFIPILIGAGYYTYTQVSAARTTINQTLTDNVDLQTGLVGHWTFDGPDMTTATATDKSGNGNNGTLVNGPKPTLGKTGQGLSFDGVNDHVQVQDTNAHSIGTAGIDSSFTVATWVKKTSTGSGYVVTKSDPTDTEWVINASNLSSWSFFVFDAQDDYIGRSAPPIEANEWVHLVATYDGSESSSGIRLYKNSIQVDNANLNSGTYNGSENRAIGIRIGYWYDQDIPFNGDADDVRIYNRALSAKEIQALYNLGAGSKINVAPETPTNLQTGLVGHWTFDGPDMTTATATDKSGNGNNGTLTGSPPRVPGKIGQAIYGRSGSGVSASSTAQLNNIENLTVAFWYQPSRSQYGNVYILGKSLSFPGSTGWAVSTAITGRSITFYKGHLSLAGQWQASAVPFKANEWIHIAISYNHDSTSNVPTFYVNGESYSASTIVSPLGTRGIDTGVQFYMNNTNLFNSATESALDDVRIYNRILSADEVRQLYELGLGSTVKICKESSVQDADGNTYNTIAIGSQCWLDRNMNVGTRINASTNQTNNGTIEKYCYSNTDSNCTTNNPNKPDGGLYQWNEAMQYSTTEGAQGICPAGFHIPTDAEWHTLEKFLTDSGQACDQNRDNAYGCSPAKTKLLPGGASGLNANNAGYWSGAAFFQRPASAYLMSSTMKDGSSFWYRRLDNTSSTAVIRVSFGLAGAISVRCIQD